jgi:hypothetical protein
VLRRPRRSRHGRPPPTCPLRSTRRKQAVTTKSFPRRGKVASESSPDEGRALRADQTSNGLFFVVPSCRRGQTHWLRQTKTTTTALRHDEEEMKLRRAIDRWGTHFVRTMKRGDTRIFLVRTGRPPYTELTMLRATERHQRKQERIAPSLSPHARDSRRRSIVRQSKRLADWPAASQPRGQSSR